MSFGAIFSKHVSVFVNIVIVELSFSFVLEDPYYEVERMDNLSIIATYEKKKITIDS